MAKTESKFYKLRVPHEDATDIELLGEYAPPEFPPILAEPLVIKKAEIDHLKALFRRSGPINEIKGKAMLSSAHLKRLGKRWAALFQFYGLDLADTDSRPWMGLALRLAQDFVPGLRAEVIRPSEKAMDDDARSRSAFLKVSEAMKRRQKNRSPKVSERTVLQLDFYQKRPWQEAIFGKKPDTLGAFQVRFGRDKEAVANFLLREGTSKEEAIEAFKKFGLKAPDFLSDR